MDINDVVVAHREIRLSRSRPDELQEMRRICAYHLQVDPRAGFGVAACQAVETEIERRELQQRLDSLSEGQARAEKFLHGIHRLDLWILVAGVVAALSGLVLLALEILRVFRAGI